ncbi:survival motor neuron protein [Galendromus occidentalis]|uniref:Survival motor neuron protein n=1 Tax=Galendromus occidentalis TaxID=34638 RepID=A0AAJ6W089_9ACAR|nr:survival motor neuron protein [Galendromus occidentalis]
MSSSTSSDPEDSVGEVVYSKSAGVGDQADDWDDTALIEAYDAALGGLEHELEKRKARTSTQKASCSSRGAPACQTKWSKGQFCKAQYSVDQQWYEAKIIALDGAHCIVQYLGYMDHERQPLSALRSSGGRKQRQIQMKSVPCEEEGDSEASPEEEIADDHSAKSGGSASTTKKNPCDKSSKSRQRERQEEQLGHLLHLQNQHQRYAAAGANQPKFSSSTQAPKTSKDSTRKRSSHESSMPSVIAFPPPPPPFPPGVDEICEGDEALAAMLISWYISGYHTGYYTAVRNQSKG